MLFLLGVAGQLVEGCANPKKLKSRLDLCARLIRWGLMCACLSTVPSTDVNIAGAVQTIPFWMSGDGFFTAEPQLDLALGEHLYSNMDLANRID